MKMRFKPRLFDILHDPSAGTMLYVHLPSSTCLKTTAEATNSIRSFLIVVDLQTIV